jgi:general secretion pathway protein K
MRTRRSAGNRSRARQSGAALLAVLWLVAALSAIALSIAATVRAEVERTTIHADGMRAYFLARAGVERAALWVQWGGGQPIGGPGPQYFRKGMRSLLFAFPSGEVVVDVIPEASKLNINRIDTEEMVRLLMALGVNPVGAQQLAQAIQHWRSPPGGPMSALDALYLSRNPSFPARHSSLENVEELLLVNGMTPELFYGTYVPLNQLSGLAAMAAQEQMDVPDDPGEDDLQQRRFSDDMQERRAFMRDRMQMGGSRLVWRGGLRDCVSVFGSVRQVDVNWAQPAVLAAIGVPPQAIMAILRRRHLQPFQNEVELQQLGLGGLAAMGRLRVGGRTQFTLRATAQLRTPDGQPSGIRRTVAAVVDVNESSGDRPFTTMRWYDSAWKQ